MTHTATTTAPKAAQPSLLRTVGRWMVSFAGFPLGGVAAMVTVGPVDSTWRALVGGLATGAVLGAVQALALRPDRRLFVAWTVATAAGLAVGLTIGTSLVDFGTGLGDLVVEGLVCGFVIGVAQAAVLWRRTGPGVVLWPGWLAAVWALGWTVTTAIGVEVDERFTVFGSSGAITATLLTAVLPVALRRRSRQQTQP